MAVIRAEQVAAEEAAASAGESVEESEVLEQYVFTMTDGGFAKRSRISDYRLQSRGGIGIKAMSLANEDRGGLVGAFIVVEGDEILSITNAGQVVRSPINENFRPTGRSTMGVKFVSPKSGDAVAVVARSVEAKDEEEVDAEGEVVEGSVVETVDSVDSVDGETSATVDGATTDNDVPETATDEAGEAPGDPSGESES